MRSWRAWRALIRVEWRQLRTHPRRSLLVVLLVAIPVAAVVGGSSLARIIEPTLDEQRIRAMGRADLAIDGLDHYDAFSTAIASLPDGSRHAPLFVGADEVSASGTRLRARLIAAPPNVLDGEGLAGGMVRLEAGRLPEHAGEVALSAALLDALNRSIGDAVTLEYGAERTITGRVADPEQLDAPLIVRTPAAVEHVGRRSLQVGGLASSEIAEVVAATETTDATVRLRSEVGGRSDTGDLIVALGTIGFVEAALIIAAAFAVGIRRRQREIGLLGASGAAPRGVSIALLGSAATLAAIGGAIGIGLGAAAVAVVHPFLDGWNQRLNGPFELSIGHAVIAWFLGMVTAVLAAALPARSAARLPILAALSGRRPPTHGSRRWLWAGAPLVALGGLATLAGQAEGNAAAVLGVVVGPILGLIGFGLCSPWLLDVLAGRAASLPLAWRLAVRDAGRFRGRNGPVVTAVVAGMAMSVTIAVLVASLEAAIALIPVAYRDDHLLVDGPDAEAVAEQLAESLDAVAAPLSIAYRGGEPVRARFADDGGRFAGQTIACGGDELLRVLHAEAARDDFVAGRLIALDPPDEPTETELTTWVGGRALAPLPFVAVPPERRLREPGFLLHRDALDALGWRAGPPIRRTVSPWWLRLPAPVTDEHLALSRSIAASSAGASIDAAALQPSPATGFYTVMLALCIATGLVVVLVANALTAAESANDERILLTVGAAPSLVRRHGAARAAYLAGLGCVLAIPAGLMPAIGLAASAHLPVDLVIPWSALGATLVVLPITAYSTSWWLGGRRSGRSLRPVVTVFVVATALAIAPSSVDAEPIDEPTVDWQPFVGEAFDGSPLHGELGRLVVPERHDAPEGPTLELAFVRYRTTRPDPGPPILYLAGGPGGAGTELGGKVATHPQLRLLEHRDVIAVDQRGTGLSRPNLVDTGCAVDLPFDRAPTRAEAITAGVVAAGRCVERWRGAGVDLSAYNSRQSADDLDAVRRALGVEQVVLYGSSYGSHLGLAYLRRHGEHVERAALFKVEGPDATWKLPSTVDAGWRAIVELARDTPHLRDHVPDLAEAMRTLRDRLSAEPVGATIPLDDASDEAILIVLGPNDLEVHVALAASDLETLATLPAELAAMLDGDWSSLAESTAEMRRVELNAMTLMMDCMSGASPERWRRLADERSNPDFQLGDALLVPYYPEVCTRNGLPTLDEAFRAPLESKVPILSISGTLDLRTPPSNVEALLGGLPNATHLVVENADHGGRELMAPEVRRAIQSFLRGDAVPSSRIVLPRPRFESIEPEG